MKREEGPPKKGGNKVRGDGQTLNRFNRKAVMRNKCYRRDGEYHLASRRPRRDGPRREVSPLSQESVTPQGPPYSSISLEIPVLPLREDSACDGETGCKCGQSFVTTVDLGEALSVSHLDSVVAPVAGATAKLVCVSLLARHNSVLE